MNKVGSLLAIALMCLIPRAGAVEASSFSELVAIQS
jgi:hypothetical protein